MVLLFLESQKYQNQITRNCMTSPIKEPVKIRRKTLKNGNVSLYLAIYINGHREYEFLKLYLIPEKTKADKERNKATLALANSIKSQRVVDIQSGAWGMKADYKEKTLFYNYYNALTQKRKKKESKGNFSNWSSCLHHLKKYDPRATLTFADITPKWIEGSGTTSKTRPRHSDATAESAKTNVPSLRTRVNPISTNSARPCAKPTRTASSARIP